MTRSRPISVLLAVAMAGTSGAALAGTLPVIPMPASVEMGDGSLVVGDGAMIVVPAGDDGASRAAAQLIARVATDRGISLERSETGTGLIRLVRDPAVNGDEAYRLEVTSSGIRIAASGDAGLLYGAMTLAQLLSPDSAFKSPVRVPQLSIADAPRFQWRGLMIDVARHFQPIDSLYTLVDAMAAHKLNVLHLHLTDDQGWRVEIKRYPELTRTGAWRTPPSAGSAAGKTYGGFYTQEELRKLVAYAQARAITIVPEIDMPGHAQAAVAAYPEVGVLGDRPQVSADWGINPYLFNVNDESMTFIKGVLDELMDVFPSRFIHVGGDEAIKDQWQLSPQVQAKMAMLGIKDEHGLQSWFIDQLGEYLASHGRRLIGWDEILEGGLPASASVMSWRGEQGAVDAANAGHDVVLSPAPTLYLDSLQSGRSDEPPGRLSIVTLADVYRYDPMPDGLDPARARHVLGAQVNAWTEYLVTPEQVQHAVFPRLDALSEITWTPKAGRDWSGFVARLQPQMERYKREGIRAADSAFAVGYRIEGSRGDALRANRVTLSLSSQAGFGTIRYTLDGKEPDRRSRLYQGALQVKPGTIVRAAAFDADGRATASPRSFDTSRLALLTRTSSELTACPKGALGLRVPLAADATANGPAFNVNLFDTCSLYPAAPLDQAKGFTVDVVRLARHYGLAHDYDKVRSHYNATRFGELIVRTQSCEGPVAATFPLPDPAASPQQMQFSGKLPAGKGDADICLQFTVPISGPFYAVAKLTLQDAKER
jgi:hexosaminidase